MTPPDPLPALDEAVSGLVALDDKPVEQHAVAYEEVHRLLQEALATLDQV